MNSDNLDKLIYNTESMNQTNDFIENELFVKNKVQKKKKRNEINTFCELNFSFMDKMTHEVFFLLFIDLIDGKSIKSGYL